MDRDAALQIKEEISQISIHLERHFSSDYLVSENSFEEETINVVDDLSGIEAAIRELTQVLRER